MALHLPVEEVVTEAGHDGGKIIFPLLMEPKCRKGFHSQELVRIAWQHGYAMTPVELCPRILATDNSKAYPAWHQTEMEHQERFKGIIELTFGILEGRNDLCSHAVYNYYGQIYDPEPGVPVYEFSFENCEKRKFYANQLWIFTRHKST
jgi:hypothetical protein